MKQISLLGALLFSIVGLKAATLQWDPSSTNGAPTPQFYRVHSSPVGNPAFGTWTTFGETTSTNLLVTNNVWRMFRVLAVANGVESDPSNVVTNAFAKPNPPGTAVISAMIEQAPAPNGPWTGATNVVMEVPVESTNQFFRSRMVLSLR